MLLGRDAELAEIEGVVEALEAGRGGFYLLAGDPGIGKSALLGALAERAAARGWTVLSGRGTEFERAMPYGVLVDALDAHLAGLSPDRLARMGVGCTGELAAIFPSVDGGGHFERYELHRAIAELLAGLAAARPLVLLLDDLNWSDEATLEALAALARRPPRGRVLIAGAHRPSEALDELAHQLDRQGFPRRTLPPLADADAERLIGDRVPEHERRALLEQAGGNPFYLDQLARSPAAERQLPSAVAVSIRRQVEQLSEPAQLLLRGVAVTGEPADLRLAAVAAGLDQETALDVLDEALRADLLEDASTGTAFAFRHPLVRRAVYESAGRGWRIGAHARLRRALADLDADVTLLAHHVEQSAGLGDDEAIDILIAAAERVLERAPAGAAAWLQAALRLLPDEQSERRAALEERRGVALLAAGHLAAAREALLAAGPDTAAKNYRLAEVERWLGHEREALPRLALAREMAAGGDPRLRVRIEIELMLIHEWNLRYADAYKAAASAIGVAQATGDPAVVAEVQGVMATTLVQTDPRAATPLYEQAAAAVAAHPDHGFPAHSMSLWDLGWAAVYLERFEEAIAHFDRGLAVARGRGAPGHVAMYLTDRAEPRYRSGRIGEARELAEEAVEAARVTPSRRYEWWALVRLALVLARSGDGQAAAEVVRDCERAASTLPPSPLVRLWTAQASAAAAAALGEWRAAAAALAEAGGGDDLALIAPIDRNRPRLIMVKAALADGDVERARRLARDGEAWAWHTGLQAQRGWAFVTRATVDLATGDARGAAAAAAEAAACHSRSASALETLRARVLQAACLAEAGEREAAAALLAGVEPRLHAMGADHDHRLVLRELRRLGRRVARRGGPPAADGGSAAPGLAELSPREREVAALVAEGATNRGIADSLYLSQKTVETHLRNIFAKVGVSSRSALAAAVQAGDPEP